MAASGLADQALLYPGGLRGLWKRPVLDLQAPLTLYSLYVMLRITYNDK